MTGLPRSPGMNQLPVCPVLLGRPLFRLAYNWEQFPLSIESNIAALT